MQRPEMTVFAGASVDTSAAKLAWAAWLAAALSLSGLAFWPVLIHGVPSTRTIKSASAHEGSIAIYRRHKSADIALKHHIPYNDQRNELML